MSIILSFVYEYFFEGIALFLTGLATKYVVNQFGCERAKKIKDAVVTAMLYAEEAFGIGHGDEKWSQAWQKIVKLLQEQGICLSPKEVESTTILMKATVPEINAIVYSALPEEAKQVRTNFTFTKETQKYIDQLKAKYKVKKS